MVEESIQATSADLAKDHLVFQIDREITNLSKTFLVLLEDMRDFESLISDKDFIHKRKRVLDQNGSAIRNLVSYLDKLNIAFKVQ